MLQFGLESQRLEDYYYCFHSLQLCEFLDCLFVQLSRLPLHTVAWLCSAPHRGPHWTNQASLKDHFSPETSVSKLMQLESSVILYQFHSTCYSYFLFSLCALLVLYFIFKPPFFCFSDFLVTYDCKIAAVDFYRVLLMLPELFFSSK